MPSSGNNNSSHWDWFLKRVVFLIPKPKVYVHEGVKLDFQI